MCDGAILSRPFWKWPPHILAAGCGELAAWSLAQSHPSHAYLWLPLSFGQNFEDRNLAYIQLAFLNFSATRLASNWQLATGNWQPNPARLDQTSCRPDWILTEEPQQLLNNKLNSVRPDCWRHSGVIVDMGEDELPKISQLIDLRPDVTGYNLVVKVLVIHATATSVRSA